MPIQILSPRLANQIAAGEVVERPASVVKELIENSLDSGATSIEIEIEKGGHKSILIRDNGSGIPKDELTLALSRHATSKIAKLDDLEAIVSLGFRGEALASISSVARLSLSSKPKNQAQAWQAQCEGRDMQVQLHPVAHPDGTSVEVVDLFFNTPARRKFLKTEKTEFAHIDEVIRRIALSRFDVSFSLKHNAKILRKYPAVKAQHTELKRLATVCGKEFSEHCIELNSQYQELQLTGWLTQPELAKNHSEYQYFYVNGRMMRDKLLNHAVRQAFEGLIASDLSPAYVLYLTLEPSQVDVNVHPAKHEVRFHQARIVHDFIFRALSDALNQYFQEASQANPAVTVLPKVEPQHDYIQPLQPAASSNRIDESNHNYARTAGAPFGSASALSYKGKAQHLVNSSQVINQSSKNYQQLMTATPPADGQASEQTPHEPGQWLQVSNDQILLKIAKQFYLLETKVLHHNVLSQLFSDSMPVIQPLLMPISIAANADLLAQAKMMYQPLLDNNVEIGWTPNRIILRKVPAGLRQFRWVEQLADILNCADTDSVKVRDHLLQCLVSGQELAPSQIQELWQQFVLCSENLEHDMAKLAKPVAIEKWLSSNE